ncbi:MAG: CdaR family protein [Thermodesulfobacteriota bacterium]
MKKYKPKGIRKVFAKNWLLKLVSMFFALFLWYFVVGEDKVELTITVPLEITNMQQDLVIANQFKKQLEVTVNGPRGLVRGLSKQRITRPIDLADYRPGSHVIPIKPESINFPRGIQVQHIRPGNITLVIDRLIEKELPIKPVLKGNPAAGYEIASIIADPPTLSLTAPSATLAKEVFLATKPIPIDGIKNNIKAQVQLDVKDEISDLVGEPVISINILVREKIQSRDFSGIPIEINHAGERTLYRIDSHQITVKAEMPFGMAKRPSTSFKFKAVINGGNLPPGRHEIPILITSDPPGIKILEVIPSNIVTFISRPGPIMKRLYTGPQPNPTEPAVTTSKNNQP